MAIPCPCKNADSVHSRTHPRFQGSTRDQDRDQTPEHILVFRALIEIEIELQNTSSFLGLYSRSRSRSNSGTHPRFQGSTRDRDKTPEHILVFRALLEIEIKIKIAPVHGRGTLCTSPTMQKNRMGRGQANKQHQHTDIATARPTRPRGPS